VHSKIYIFLNGLFSKPPFFPEKRPEGCRVIAADGGISHVRSLGWKEDIILGDFDSAPKELMEEYLKDKSVSVIEYPSKKDKTDFELATELSLELISPGGEIEILGALGGRWDMSISNIFVPSAVAKNFPGKKRPSFLFLDGETMIHVLLGPASVKIPKRCQGFTVSLLPLEEKAKGVTLEGLFEYPLENGELDFGLTLGLSNKLLGPGGSVFLKEGALAVFVLKEG
jgi:thiamine pyrophosphokinase